MTSRQNARLGFLPATGRFPSSGVCDLNFETPGANYLEKLKYFERLCLLPKFK